MRLLLISATLALTSLSALAQTMVIPNLDMSKTQTITIPNQSSDTRWYLFKYGDNKALVRSTPNSVKSFGMLDGIITDSTHVECFTDNNVSGIITPTVEMFIGEYIPDKECENISNNRLEKVEVVDVYSNTTDVKNGSRVVNHLMSNEVVSESNRITGVFPVLQGLSPKADMYLFVEGAFSVMANITVKNENGVVLTSSRKSNENPLTIDLIQQLKGNDVELSGVGNALVEVEVWGYREGELPPTYLTIKDSVSNGDVDGLRANYTGVRTTSNTK